MSWLRVYATEIRWTLVVLILAVVGVVALWPRGGEEPADPSHAAGDQQQENAQRQEQPPREPASAEQRAAADLDPCPRGAAASPELADTDGVCLADGEPVDLGEAVGDTPTLINVWATWCPPCRTELPVLEDYASQPDSVSVVGVQVMSPEAGGVDLLRELGVRFPNVHDSDNAIRSALNVPNVLPASYLVTEDGEVHRIDATVFHSPDEVRAAVHETLQADRAGAP